MSLLKVPHITQSAETTCGAAALCMIYWYHGLKHQSEDKIWVRLKETRKLNPNEEFIPTAKLAYDAKSNGLHYIFGQAVWDDTKKVLRLLEEFLRI